MAIAHGHQDAGLTPRQTRALARAEFFETVRAIVSVSAEGGIGDDTRPQAEPLRFRAEDGLGHPDVEIVALRRDATTDKVEMTVGHMGLTGPMGVLPDHYTDMVVERRRGRDEALSRFLDLFNHRAISLFYRAWAKYRLPVRFAETGGDFTDPFSQALAALAGLGRLDDPSVLAAAGPLARRTRSPSSIRRMIAALFDLPIALEELRERRIRIAPDEQSRLGSRHGPRGRYATLGQDVVLGASAWDAAGRFRIRVGPIDRATFASFMAVDGMRRRFVEAVRFAVGGTVDFDIQLVLRADQVPAARLGGEAPSSLAQSAWLLGRPATRDRDDAIFSGAGR